MTRAFEAVELDILFCRLRWKETNAFGTCSATGSTPCYNTRETTQAPNNYNPGTVTLRYTKPSGFLPDDIEALPYLQSVDYSPATIAPGKSLGERSSVTFIFRDAPYGDTGEGYDKYRVSRPYNPAIQGTYWGKLRARHRSLRGRSIRWIVGQVGQPLDAMEVRHFVVDSIDGPRRDGTFAIIAKDVLKLADGDRSQTPKVTNGSLSADLAANGSSFTAVFPAGYSNTQYPTASHYVSIGANEVIRVTRSGNTFTVAARAQFGTTAVAHSAGDRIQLCRVYSAQKPSVILSDILQNDCGLDPTFVPLSEWQTEEDTYLQRLYSRCISEPESSRKVIDEFIEQAGLVVWPDELGRAVRMQVLRGIPSDATVFAPDTNIEKGSLTFRDQPETRISRSVTRFALRSPLMSSGEPQSYRSVRQLIDVDAELIYGSPSIREIAGTWIPQFGDTTADRTNELQVGRFSTPPRRFTFEVSRHAGVLPVMGMGARLRCPEVIQDVTGAASDTPIQITRVMPGPASFKVEAEEMLVKIFNPQDIKNRTILINASAYNLNILAIHNSLYPALTLADVAAGVNVTVVLAAGVKLGSTSTSSPALDLPAGWPTGLPITIEVYGYIYGKGGDGATGRLATYAGGNGLAGGPALRLCFPCALKIKSGSRIWSGGGGGASGGGSPITREGYSSTRSGAGGGGFGRDPGAGPSSVGAGSETAGGSGGPQTNAGSGVNLIRWGAGGDGGGPGQAGANGASGRAPNNANIDPVPGGTGGQAGKAIDGTSYIGTYENAGSILGPTSP